MTMPSALRQIAIANRDNESAKGVIEFARLAQFVMANDGRLSKAAVAATASSRSGNLGPRLADIIRAGAGGISRDVLREQKAAVVAGGLTGSPFSDFSIIAQGFVSALVNAGAFDAMLSSFVPTPLKTGSIGGVSVAAQAFSVGEGGVKPVSKLTIVGQQQNPVKAHGIIVATQELVRMAAPQATQLISLGLRSAVAVTSDAQMIAALTSGLSATTSTGQTAEAVRSDISNLLKQVTTGQTSKLFIVTTPLICKMWSMLTDGHGLSAFENLTPTGGSINGVTVLVSDAVTAGNVLLVDASGVAAVSGDVTLSEFREGMVQLDSAPDSPPSALSPYVSLWQMNYVAILCERFLAVTRFRSDACALCSNSNSYQSGNSPP